jgi:hypothetical protein
MARARTAGNDRVIVPVFKTAHLLVTNGCLDGLEEDEVIGSRASERARREARKWRGGSKGDGGAGVSVVSTADTAEQESESAISWRFPNPKPRNPSTPEPKLKTRLREQMGIPEALLRSAQHELRGSNDVHKLECGAFVHARVFLYFCRFCSSGTLHRLPFVHDAGFAPSNVTMDARTRAFCKQQERGSLQPCCSSRLRLCASPRYRRCSLSCVTSTQEFAETPQRSSTCRSPSPSPSLYPSRSLALSFCSHSPSLCPGPRVSRCLCYGLYSDFTPLLFMLIPDTARCAHSSGTDVRGHSA